MSNPQEVLDSSEFWCVVNGEALEVLQSLPDDSVDSLICDPPGGIDFMGKDWDADKGGWDQWIEALATIMKEALRVLKPGGYGLVWAIPRTSHWTGMALEIAGFEIVDRLTHIFGQGWPKSKNLLKPAVEDWWLVRRSGESSLNISDCLVEPSGRWPANLLLSHVEECLEKCAEGCPIKTLDEQSGLVGQLGPQLTGNEPSEAETGTVTGKRKRVAQAKKHDDKGGASKFFTRFKYEPKASRSEREYGCENLPSPNPDDPNARRNTHPTVKPVELMRWLCRLITPPGGVVLDPFAGSGSTGIGALKEGFRFIGIDKDAHYCEIAIARLAATWNDLISD